METLTYKPVDRNFDPLSAGEIEGLKRFGDVYATFLSQYRIDALALAGGHGDKTTHNSVLLAQIAAYKEQKRNGNGQKGGDTRCQ